MRLVEKYRPHNWSEIIGQDKVVSALKRIANRGWSLPHMLFIGPPGSGKTSVANVLGKVLDLPVLEYNASDDRGIEFIREEVKKQAQYKIEQIIFLDEGDQLTNVAQQAMRRIMEETKSAIFILAGNEEWKLIDAIKSRCSIFRFKRIPDELVQQKIVEVIRGEGITINATTPEEQEGVRNAIKLLAKKAQGDLRTALNDLEQIVDEHQTITLESVAVIESSVGLYTLAMRQALAGKFEEAKTTIEKAYVEGHFDPRTSFQEIYDAIPGLTIDREVKIRLFAKLGEAEANSKRGSNPIIQIVSFISFVWLIPYLSACPVLSKSLGGTR